LTNKEKLSERFRKKILSSFVFFRENMDLLKNKLKIPRKFLQVGSKKKGIWKKQLTATQTRWSN
jgi:hypothetical protein